MKTSRLIAWAVALLVCFGAYKGLKAWSNPWRAPDLSIPSCKDKPECKHGL